jgi:predicted  nucleic acid-binding Zn-ribbon protein
LSSTLELGKDLTALSAHNAHETNLKTIDQLNQQIDFLNNQMTLMTAEAQDLKQVEKELENAIEGERKALVMLHTSEKEKADLRQALHNTEVINNMFSNHFSSIYMDGRHTRSNIGILLIIIILCG